MTVNLRPLRAGDRGEADSQRGQEATMPAPMIGHHADEATREEIAAEIADVKRKHDRLPVHYEARRAELMEEIDALVDDWLAARG